MCGILGFFGNESTGSINEQRQKFIDLSNRIRHRGPDWSGIWTNEELKTAICHERLSIVGVDSGSQPIHNKELGIVLAVNGEIYNYKELYKTVLYNKYRPHTKSDCEVIIYLYKEYGAQCVKMLDGIFGFILFDYINQKVLVARDPIGVIPVYYGQTSIGETYISSELKCIHDQCDAVNVFPPSHYLMSDLSLLKEIFDTDASASASASASKFERYFELDKSNLDSLTMDECSKDLELNSNGEISKHSELYLLMKSIKDGLEDAVEKRLMADVPYGVLVSGGLDSSLITAIVAKKRKQMRDAGILGNLHTFSIGLKGAPDLKYARIVADFLETTHHEFTFTVQDGIDAIPALIYHLETFDRTTIRASTPMFLMSRLIKSHGIKMVLSGEGADEILGGYLYFHNAPDSETFHEECHNRVNGLHHFDCLRANKSTMSWGVEARVPFLDRNFLQIAMSVHPSLKLHKDKKIEKFILRKAFDKSVCGETYLPDEILWRQKEQFSDGVGYDWIDGLKDFIETQITDEEFEQTIKEMKANDSKDIPKTKEDLYYRRIFDEKFPHRENIVPRWIPRTDWDGVSYDPSGRAQTVHTNHL
jgi:asparagine synthase (glutamine-hydrolysing)